MEKDFCVENQIATNEYTNVLNNSDLSHWNYDKKRINGGILVDPSFIYDSKNNVEWMSIESLKAWIKKNYDKVGKI